VRPNSLISDKLDDFLQVVGHTTQQILIIDNEIMFIDTLGTSGEYLIWPDTGNRNEFIVGKTK
jgi:hypothetical protein